MSNVNAMFEAFERDRVPQFPYANLKKGMSEWISQADHFCVTFVRGLNALHRKYTHGFPLADVHAPVVDNYHDKVRSFLPCDD